jgi:tetratricopeptide (TPR) repeat protein
LRPLKLNRLPFKRGNHETQIPYNLMKKTIWLIFVLLSFFGSPVMGSAPIDPAKDLLSQGIQKFKAGQFQQAFDTLQNAFGIDPGNPELNFYLGRAAFETGDYESAVMAYERILMNFPHEQRVKLELARAFQKLGSNDVARRYANEVLLANPPMPVKENIRAFLAAIDKSEQNHFFSGHLSTGVTWDSNVYASPADPRIGTIIGDIILTGDSAQETSDWIFNTTLGLEHIYQIPDSKYSWKTTGIFHNALYQDTSELDLLYVGGNTGPELISGKNRYGLKFLATQIDRGETQYMTAMGGKATMDRFIKSNFFTGAALRYESKDYHQIPGKDAKTVSLSFNTSFLLKKNWFNILLIGEKEDAENDVFSYTRVIPRISVSRVFPFQLTGTASYTYQYSGYDEKEPLFPEKRKDHIHYARLNLRRSLWQSAQKNQSVSLDLNYLHTNADSNIELYEYTKDTAELSLIYDF